MCTPETEGEYSKGAVRGPKFFEELRDGSPCRDHPDRKTGFSAVFVNIDSSPPSSSSSESSTPTGSPTSSVSCDHHFCGSLFVKCAEHGRWPLLQTFTNRDSPLSKQTFSTRGRHRKSDNLHDVICKSDECDEKNLYENLLYVSRKRPPNKAVSRLSSELSLPSENCEKKNFLKKNFEKSFGRNINGQLITRKHHSLPSNRVVVDAPAVSEFGKIKKSSALPSNGDQLYVSSENSEEAKFESRKKGSSKKVLNSCLVNFNEGKEKKNSVEDEGCLNRHTKTSAKKDWRNFSSKSENNYSSSQLRLDSAKGNGEKSDSEMLRKSCSNHFGWSRRQSLDKKLNKEAKEWEHRIDYLETEVLLLQRELKKRDQEKIKLQREVHKLKSVLQETSIFNHEGDLLSSLQDSHGMPGQIQHVVNIPNPNKKQGISGESSDHGRNHDQIEIQRFEKDFRSKQLIKDAIMENDFLKNLDTSQVREIVESVYPKEFCEGDYVLREGEAGSHLYVTAEGELEVVKDHKVLGRMGPGKAFGELAILYNCRRTASIKVVSHAKVWVLDRRVFQQIMMKTGLQRLQENLNFLRSVPLLQSLSNEVLAKIADVLEVDFYPSGEHIIRQGASGDTFFIISSGSVKVTQQKPGRHEEEDIRILNKGDYFGEQALLKEDWRTANVIALSPGVECLTLDRESFIQLIGDLSELQEKDYGDQIRSFSRPSSSSSLCDKEEYDYIRLEDLDVVSTLGVGGFGRVELVQYAKNKNMTFALKCLKKQHIVETKQQEHVYSERNIMMACSSPFICRLYKTFRDSKYVYMLQEVLLGGEVWTILRERGYFDEYTTKFVTGCVLEAFEYLHARGIVYRDLKPENLLLDNTGYAKLVDFGFSKRVGFSSKTWTFCGTPEYLAPEIILNKGHDRAVDYWSLGILMHELLTGIPPFAASDPMRTYNIILKGIDMIDFPKHITRTAINLIKKLCRDAPCERLGYQRGGILDIKKHKWFQGFDWSGLKQRILIPPISPLVRSPTDTSNFDFYSKDTAVPPDEFSNWDAEF